MKTLPVTIDYAHDLESHLGSLLFGSKKAEFLYNLLEAGHTFEVAPTLSDGKLVGLSIISLTARKVQDDSKSK